MSTSAGPNIVKDGLVLCLDAGNLDSYPGTGTTWYDISGNNNHLTLINGPIFNTSNGGNIIFDGVNDYGRTNLSSSLNMSNSSITGEVLLKINSYNANERMIFEYSIWNQTGTYQITTFGNTVRFNFVLANQANKYTDYIYSDLTNNKWIHIIGQHDTVSNVDSLYINGSQVAITSNVTQEIGSQITNLYVGARGGTQMFLSYNISNINIYNRALSSSEIQQNFNSIRGRFGL